MKIRGFSLIEVLAVIVILAIMGVVVIPRLSDVRGETREASMRWLAGSMRTSAGLTVAKWNVNGQTGSTVAMADGTVVDVLPTSGHPRASGAGIDSAARVPEKIVCSGSPVRTCVPVDGPASCSISYDERTGMVDTSALDGTSSAPGKSAGKGKGKGLGIKIKTAPAC